MPVILPALIKLNWQDYFGGAAMAGVSCVIGEGSPGKDAGLVMENGKITSFPMLAGILDAFRRYDRGYGQIVLQCNCEDDAQGLPEYAIAKHGLTALEFKFGQSAKGTQPVQAVSGGLEGALKKQAAGALVHPDPSDPAVQKAYADGVCPNFYTYGRLPMWDETYFVPRVRELRQMGLKNVYFKMAGYDRADLEHVLRIACMAGVDMVTFDGAGGGSGYSPCKMMNEWALPTVCMEAAIVDICKKLTAEGLVLPAITVTGGFATEDQVFKALAFGAPYVTAVGLCRASMAAAMSAKKPASSSPRAKCRRTCKNTGRPCRKSSPICRSARPVRQTGRRFLPRRHRRLLVPQPHRVRPAPLRRAQPQIRRVAVEQDRPDPPDPRRPRSDARRMVQLVTLSYHQSRGRPAAAFAFTAPYPARPFPPVRRCASWNIPA